MSDPGRVWRTMEADGTRWQVSVVPEEGEATGGAQDDHELIEFRSLDGLKPARRLAIPTGSFAAMDDAALASAFRKARPIGGDYYGRPGKRMPDTNP